MFQTGVISGPNNPFQRVLSQHHASSLELDINTLPDFGVIECKLLPTIFRELTDMGLEIMTKGDIG